jgi:hypothetical protein
MSVTDRACARSAPATGVADLERSAKKMFAAFTLVSRYLEVRKHWWFIEPDDLMMMFAVFAVMSLLWLVSYLLRRRKRKALRFPIGLWVGFSCAALLLGLAILMFSLQGPAPMYLQDRTSLKKTPNQALLPTSMSVTDHACACSAPDTLAADL